jgi:FMN phosphatase YigB (HAD superfamily)
VISPEIKNIIFDLGGVIINLSIDATVQRFSMLTGLTSESIYRKLATLDLFKEHEKGTLSDPEFRDGVRAFMNVRCTDEEIDESWNAMLLDIPFERIDLLQKLGKKYRLFLLSNTNEIHVLRFTETLSALQGKPSFGDLFEKVYYSHRLLMRKPEKEIFEHVLEENNLIAGQTLFLDDNQDNLNGAAGVGIKTFHVQRPDSLFSLFELTK